MEFKAQYSAYLNQNYYVKVKAVLPIYYSEGCGDQLFLLLGKAQEKHPDSLFKKSFNKTQQHFTILHLWDSQKSEENNPLESKPGKFISECYLTVFFISKQSLAQYQVIHFI